jgi:hypothetical protein
MATRPESKFSQKFVKATKDKVHWTRIESWALPGVADLHGVCPSGSFWVETKIVDLRSVKIRTLTAKQIGLRPQQIQWQWNYARAGGIVYNLVHRPHSSLLQLYAAAQLDEEPWSPLLEAGDDNLGLKMMVDYILTENH